MGEELRLEDVTVGVITALPKEYTAMRVALGCSHEVSAPGTGAGRRYSLAEIAARGGGRHVVAVALLTQMGNNSAAVRATKMLEHCATPHIIMAGIAGAIPNPAKADEHVRLGDLVISNHGGVVKYDSVKETLQHAGRPNPVWRAASLLGRAFGIGGGTPPRSGKPHELKIEPRHPPRPPSAELLDAVNYLEALQLEHKFPWEEHIVRVVTELKGGQWSRPPDSADRLQDWEGHSAVQHPIDQQRRPGVPRLFYGRIASADRLLKNPEFRNILRDKFKSMAVEMEGSGIADATWDFGVGYLVVRGTCDYCNWAKADAWQGYAAVAAACYTRCLIEVIDVRRPPSSDGHLTAESRQETVGGDGQPNPAELEQAKAERIRAESNHEVLRHLMQENASLRSELRNAKRPATSIPSAHELGYTMDPEDLLSEGGLQSGASEMNGAICDPANLRVDGIRGFTAPPASAAPTAADSNAQASDARAKAWLEQLGRMLGDMDVDIAASLANGEVVPWLYRHEFELSPRLASRLYAQLTDLRFRQARRARSDEARRVLLVEAELFLEKAKSAR